MRNLAVLDQASIDQVRATALQRVAPLQPGGPSFFDHYRDSRRTDAGRALPPYFLVYFLLVDLLEFPDLGQEEKTAWSVPVEFNGHRFLVQHTKFGVGVFGATDAASEAAAKEVTTRIHRGCREAKPFFDHLAAQAIQSGQINVLSHSVSLYGRFEFLRGLLRTAEEELERLHVDPQAQVARGLRSRLESNPLTRDWRRIHELRTRVAWLHQSVIEAFFSWTEHALVHVAVVNGRISSGPKVDEVTLADWPTKFTTAFELTDLSAKRHYDALVEVRREHRNFTTHGAFGKEGEAFQFHSGAGAVSIRMEDDRKTYTMVPSGVLSDVEAMAKVDAFIDWLQSGTNEPLWIYLQSGLRTVFTWTTSGLYQRALSSVEEMNEFIEYQERLQDDSANMDW